jgi:hypothetical protein
VEVVIKVVVVFVAIVVIEVFRVFLKNTNELGLLGESCLGEVFSFLEEHQSTL